MLKILRDVARRGDQALLEYTRRLDGHLPKRLEVTPAERRLAMLQAEPKALAALKEAARRIERFHRRQLKGFQSWELREKGLTVGQRITPLERVGIYVPGGRAAYPSTVLMNAIPARVAGVREIIMVTPFPEGQVNPYTLVAAELVGVDRIFKVGGAQAIAALAYGTRTIPRVDKIVGPGNRYVALAKAQVAASGQVGIDGFAGPTEVVIIADAGTSPVLVAADLISQAEHDPEAQVFLISPSAKLITAVRRELQRQVRTAPRRAIIRRVLDQGAKFIRVRSLEEACARSNEIAPEHLELMVPNPRRLLRWIRHAGAIFLGPQTPVALGDYAAGPNHVLPTSGTARFASPLGVGDFLKTSSVIEAQAVGLKGLANTVQQLAQLEGLTAHAESVRLRLGK